MDYLTDSATFTLNGKDRRMGAAIDNGHVIIFPRKGALDDIVVSAAVLIGVAAPVLAIPVGLIALGLDKAVSRSQQQALADTLGKIRRKFRLAETDILIANNETSSARLSGNSFLSFGNTIVSISGRFAVGDQTSEVSLSCAFNAGKARLQRLFERNGYRVQN